MLKEQFKDTARGVNHRNWMKPGDWGRATGNIMMDYGCFGGGRTMMTHQGGEIKLCKLL